MERSDFEPCEVGGRYSRENHPDTPDRIRWKAELSAREECGCMMCQEKIVKLVTRLYDD